MSFNETTQEHFKRVYKEVKPLEALEKMDKYIKEQIATRGSDIYVGASETIFFINSKKEKDYFNLSIVMNKKRKTCYIGGNRFSRKKIEEFLKSGIQFYMM